MKKLYPIALLTLLTLSFHADAQRWKRFRHEVWGGIGGTNFLGELGGADQQASDLITDFDFKSSRYCIGGGYRYKLAEAISLRGSLLYGRITASDEFTNEPFRKSRNLKFRSHLVELSAVGELYFIREKVSNRYRVRGISGNLVNNLSAYVFGGVAGFWFNPMGEYNGKWYALQPLGTEGQTLPGGKKYSRIAISLPMGIGAKYALDQSWSIGLEYGVRLTNTDYMDDVSTKYPDPMAVKAVNGSNGDAAAYLSNPAMEVVDNEGRRIKVGGLNSTSLAGQQRGDPTTNDTYMFAVLSLNYKFISRKTNRPKF